MILRITTSYICYCNTIEFYRSIKSNVESIFKYDGECRVHLLKKTFPDISYFEEVEVC